MKIGPLAKGWLAGWMAATDVGWHGQPFLPLTRDSNVNLATKKISKTNELATPFTILVEE